MIEVMRNTFTMLPSGALDDDRLSRTELSILAILYKFAIRNENKKSCTVTVFKEILKAEGKYTSDTTYYNSLKKLEQCGYIINRVERKTARNMNTSTEIRLRDARRMSQEGIPAKKGGMIERETRNALISWYTADCAENEKEEDKGFIEHVLENTRVIYYEKTNHDTGDTMRGIYLADYWEDGRVLDIKTHQFIADEEGIPFSIFNDTEIKGLKKYVEEKDKDFREKHPELSEKESAQVEEKPQDETPPHSNEVAQESNVIPFNSGRKRLVKRAAKVEETPKRKGQTFEDLVKMGNSRGTREHKGETRLLIYLSDIENPKVRQNIQDIRDKREITYPEYTTFTNKIVSKFLIKMSS